MFCRESYVIQEREPSATTWATLAALLCVEFLNISLLKKDVAKDIRGLHLCPE